MNKVDISAEAVELAIQWWQQQDVGTEEDASASAELARMLRSLRSALTEAEITANVMREVSQRNLAAAEAERDEAVRSLAILEADFDCAVKDQAARKPRHVRATLLAPWLAPVLAGALFILWVVAHLVRWAVL